MLQTPMTTEDTPPTVAPTNPFELLRELSGAYPELLRVAWSDLNQAQRKALHACCRAGRDIARAGVVSLRLSLSSNVSNAERPPQQHAAAFFHSDLSQKFPHLQDLSLEFHDVAQLAALTATSTSLFPKLTKLSLAISTQPLTCHDATFLANAQPGNALCQMLARCTNLRSFELLISAGAHPNPGFHLTFAPPRHDQPIPHLADMMSPQSCMRSILGSATAAQHLVQLRVCQPASEHSSWLSAVAPPALASAANLTTVELSHVHAATPQLRAAISALTQVTRLSLHPFYKAGTHPRPLPAALGLTPRHRIQHLTLTHADPSCVREASTLPNLHTLHIAAPNNFGGAPLSAVVAAYAAHFQTLTASIGGATDITTSNALLGAAKCSYSFPALEALTISHSSADDQVEAAHFTWSLLTALQAPRLRELAAATLPAPAGMHVLQTHPQLLRRQHGVRLSFGTVRASGVQLAKMAAHAPELLAFPVHLFEGSEAHLQAAIAAGGGGFAGLRLWLNFHTDTTDVALQLAATSCCNLTQLSLESEYQFTSAGVGAVSALTSLTCLRLLGCVGLDDAAFTAVTSSCKQLRKLCLDGLRDVSERALLTLSSVQSPGERCMLFLNENNLTPRGMFRLRRAGWCLVYDWQDI